MMRITTRADLNVGLICNLKCRFCYDLDTLNLAKGPSIEELRRRMVVYKKCGIKTVEITGGEATLRKDLVDIIRMVKEDFGIDDISIITNGFKLANESYMREVVKAGVKEFLFSIQAASAQLHDQLVDVNGSFERVMKAIDMAGRMGVGVRANTTVTAYNYDKVSQIAGMLSSYKINNYNLIMFSPHLDSAKRSKEMAVRYSVAAPFLKRLIDEYKNVFQYLYVKYIPPCFMQGYEKYVVNQVQTSYVPFDWDYCLRARIRRGELLYWLGTAAGVLLSMTPRYMLGRPPKETLRDAFLNFQEITNKHKPFKCNACKYSLICQGVWDEYNKDFGVSELIPVKGDKVLKPYYFYGEGVK